MGTAADCRKQVFRFLLGRRILPGASVVHEKCSARTSSAYLFSRLRSGFFCALAEGERLQDAVLGARKVEKALVEVEGVGREGAERKGLMRP